MTVIKNRRGTVSQWTAANPVLAEGEIGFETDSGKHKIGNGVSAWLGLHYFVDESGLSASIAAKVSADAADSSSAIGVALGRQSWRTKTRPVPRKPYTRIIETFDTGHGFTNQSSTLAAVADDATDWALGSGSVKVTTKSDGTGGGLQKTGMSIDLTGQQLVAWVKIADISHLAAMIVYASNDAFSSYYQWTWQLNASDAQALAKSGEWVAVTLNVGDALVVGTPTRAALTAIRLRTQTLTGYSTDAWYGGLATVAEQSAYPNGVVSISFDDSYASQYTMARPILAHAGAAATAYHIADKIDSDPFFLTSAQVEALEQVNGWYNAGHAFTTNAHGLGLANITLDALDIECRGMRQFMSDRGWRGQDHLAWPLGNFSPAAIDVVKQYFVSARSIIAQTPLDNGKPMMPYRMKSFSLVDANKASINARVDAAAASQGHLHIVIHNLVADAATPGSVDLKVGDFQALITYITTTKGMPIRTLDEVLYGGPELSVTPFIAPSAAAAGVVTNLALDNSAAKIQAVSRKLATTGFTATAGTGYISCFTPAADITIAALTARSFTTLWTGQTLVRFGLYTVDASGNVALVGATASDTSLFIAASTVYRKSLSTGGGLPASYTMKAGLRYGIAILGVGQTAGNLTGMTPISNLESRDPVLGGVIGTGLTDLPLTATISATGVLPWAEAG